MKELIAICTTVLAVATGGVTAGQAAGTSAVVHERGNHISVATLHALDIKAKEAINAAHMARLRENKLAMEKAIRQLKSHVNKTWYVFSGATPRGWDCSGLVVWTYEQLGVTLEHRASKQVDAGTKVADPKVGDIVAFTYKGSKSAYHVGIYVGNGKMVHAPKHGHLTRVESVSKFAGEYSKVSYARIIETI